MTVGRNAPCPCGSGKKYKRCCLPRKDALKLKPQSEPPIINHHLVNRNGVWHKAPGRIMITLAYKNEEDVDTRIEQLFDPVFLALGDLENPVLRRRLHDCKHKLYAVRWHTKAITAAIEKQAAELRKEAGGFSGVTAERLNPELICLTEDFLFQVVGSIEVLTQALHHVIPCLKSYLQERTKFLEGGKLVKALSGGGEKDLAAYFQSVWDNWLSELTEMRNTVTHRSALKDLRCFQEEPYDGEAVVIRYPCMPGGQQVHDYCNEVMEHVMECHEGVLAHIHGHLSSLG